ncbi:MAG TPA: hypothetical protein VMK31_02025 [Sphingomicrobium sp.]|nr:hypothetical protein [Sphingomicrobium sp.]
MRKRILALGASFALPLATPAAAQVPADIELESVRPMAGSWTYRAIPGGTEAGFADSAGVQRLVIRCNRVARIVSVARTGVARAAPMLAIWTSSSARSVPSRFLPSAELVADLSAADPLLDAIAFSRGRFATGAAGAPLVAVPTSAEAFRVIEDCRK